MGQVDILTSTCTEHRISQSVMLLINIMMNISDNDSDTNSPEAAGFGVAGGSPALFVEPSSAVAPPEKNHIISKSKDRHSYNTSNLTKKHEASF
jgi:hypothetical protein